MAWFQNAGDSIHSRSNRSGRTGDNATAIHPRTRIFMMTVTLALAVASCTPAPTTGASPSGTAPSPTASGESGSPSVPERTTAAGSPTPQVPGPGSIPLGWGPEQQDADKARAAVAAMSVERKAGQVLLPLYTGLDHTVQVSTIERLHLAGSIIMGDNVPGTASGQVDTAAMTAVNTALQNAARADGRTWPGLIAVDQEGGLVARLRSPLTEWPAPMSYGAAGSVPLASESGRAMAEELTGLGFTVDFAPDADVTIGPADPTIGSRSMSQDPDAAGELAVGFAEGMLHAGVLPAIKHFPGHGSVTVDSHLELPVQHAGTAELEARDWKPFRAAIAAGLPLIMTGHIAVPALDPGMPASVSRATYTTLRNMGFKGVAVTDALNMGSIQKQFPGGEVAPKALDAGADLLLMPNDIDAAHAAIVGAVAKGTLRAERLDEAAQRVATMMIWRGRIAEAAAADPGTGAELSRKLSATAVTVLSGPCSGPIVGGSVRVAGGSEQDRARFEQAARNAGISVGAGTRVDLIGFGGAPVNGEVAVALDAPWPLAASVAGTKIALYGRSPGAFDALLAVLTGKATAPGKLPADVGPYPRGSGCP